MTAVLGDSARSNNTIFRTLWRICDNHVTDPFLRLLPLFFLLMTLVHVTAAETNRDEVPFSDDGVMIRVPAKVFGKTLYFSVDTGFSRSAIDSRYASLLGAALSTNSAEGPLGKMDEVSLYAAPEISLCGKTLPLKEVLCVDLRMLRWVSGQPCDGILGIDCFSNGVLSLNFNRRTLALRDSVPESIKSNFIAAPLKNTGANFVLPVQVDGTASLELVIDTGDSSSTSLNVAEWNEVFDRPSMNQCTTTLAGIGEQVATSKIGVIPWLSLQSLNYTNLHATYIRNPAESSHVGLGFFRRHNVVFDFPNRTLYLKPNRSFSMPDEEDMSGLHLLRQSGSTKVYSVDEGSPAFEQGIRSQDSLVSINGQDSAALSMDAIRRILHSGNGRKIALEFKRGNDVVDCNIALRKML